MSFQTNLDSMPHEIIGKIMDYILNPQPKELLNDIKNYHITKEIGLKLYKKKIITNDYKEYFTNDIAAYLNEDNAMIYGCVDNFYNTIRRLYQNKHKDKLDIIKYYLKYLINKSVDIELNMMWGILTPNERWKILEKYYNKDDIKFFYLELNYQFLLPY